jgi:CRP-like cAMP-binding protein
MELQKILSLATEKVYQINEMIFEEGVEDPNFYIILRGEVEISKKTTEGEPKVIAELVAGEFLGEGVLSGMAVKPASAKAIQETTLMILSREKFEGLIEKEPRTAVDFLLTVTEAVSSRLNKTNTKLVTLFEVSQLLDMYRDDLRQLGSGLINKLRSVTESEAGVLLVKNPYDNQFRQIYSSESSLSLSDLPTSDFCETKRFESEKHQYLSVSLGSVGCILLRRPRDFRRYEDDQIRLLMLVAEQVARSIRDASDLASQKARRLLHQKQIRF